MPYTVKETARLNEFTEITYLQAVALGAELDKSPKSIVSKAQFMGIPYIKKEVPAPKEPQTTKAELVASIAKDLGVTAKTLEGLTGATRDALVMLQTCVED